MSKFILLFLLGRINQLVESFGGVLLNVGKLVFWHFGFLLLVLGFWGIKRTLRFKSFHQTLGE